MIDMKYSDTLMQAARIVDERGKQYGTVDECFSRIAKMASAFFGEEISEYKIAMILHMTKLGRIGEKQSYEDNYVDGINYLAFAAQFAERDSARNQRKIDAFVSSRMPPVDIPEED